MTWLSNSLPDRARLSSLPRPPLSFNLPCRSFSSPPFTKGNNNCPMILSFYTLNKPILTHIRTHMPHNHGRTESPIRPPNKARPLTTRARAMTLRAREDKKEPSQRMQRRRFNKQFLTFLQHIRTCAQLILSHRALGRNNPNSRPSSPSLNPSPPPPWGAASSAVTFTAPKEFAHTWYDCHIKQ